MIRLASATRARLLSTMLAVTALVPACFAQAGSLTGEVREAISQKKFGSSKVAVSIRDVDSGLELAGIRSSDPMTPASNMKLLSSGAALLTLTPDFVFRTELVQDGDRLILRGSGDPALADPAILQAMSPKLTVADVLDVMARGAQKAGLTGIRELVVDDRVFDRQNIHPDWPIDQLNRGYCAEVSGLNFHANILLVFPRPSPEGSGGTPPYSLEPEAPWLRIQNRARTVNQGKNSIWLARDPQTDDLVMRGEVRVPTTVGVEVTIKDPALFTGRLLADALNKQGVAVAPSAIRLAAPSETLGSGKTLAVVTTPIAEVLRRCNTDSENLYAESLLKRTAFAVTREPGSWTNGAAVLRMVLSQHMGADEAARTTIADGSGMSRNNAVAPATLTRWLAKMSENPTTGDMFTKSLATIGEGTLKSRYQDARLRNELRAKSGYISGVRCLSGYLIHAQSGRRVAFSVMINELSGDNATQAAFDLNKDVIKLCDDWLTGQVESDRPKVGG